MTVAVGGGGGRAPPPPVGRRHRADRPLGFGRGAPNHHLLWAAGRLGGGLGVAQGLGILGGSGRPLGRGDRASEDPQTGMH